MNDTSVFQGGATMFIHETSHAQLAAGWQKLSVDEMAATMQSMHAAGVRTTQDNLRQRGYSEDDISRFGLRAAHLARARASIQAVSA